MKAVKYWAMALVTDIPVFLMLYCWKVEGVASVGDLVVFWVWVLTVICVVIGLMFDKTHFKNQRPFGFVYYHLASEIVVCSLFVLSGFVWLPAVRIFADFLVEGARNREPKSKTGEVPNVN